MNALPSCPCRKPPHHARGAWHGLLPGLALIFMPKCPACVAAYVAAFTGFSLSTGMAAGLRTALIILCMGWLLAAAFTMIRCSAHTKRTSQRHPSLPI